MQSDAVRLKLLSRSLGPACSNIECFFLDDPPQPFRVYAVPGGAILFQRLSVCRNDTKKQGVMTEVVMDGAQSPSTNRVEDVHLLAWAASKRYLLAAATQSDLTVHSLKAFVDDSTSQCPCHRLLCVPFGGILDMKWTGDGTGLMLSDSRCQISCVAITVDQTELTSSVVGSLEVLWVIKTNIPQSIVAPGPTPKSPFAATSAECPIIIYDAEHLRCLQELSGTMKVLEFAWCPIRNVRRTSTESSLFTVSPDGQLTIWTLASDAGGTYLGSTKLQSASSSEGSIAFKAAIIAEAEGGIVPGSMNMTWVHVNEDFDPRLSWIATTYLTDIDGHLKKHCCLYVIRGLPVRFEGIPVNATDVPSFLHCSTEMQATAQSGSTIQAVLLTLRSVPELLLIESSRQETSSMTASALYSVNYSSPERALDISTEMMHEDHIVGFASSVSQLIVHPFHDCVGVLTEDGALTVWDLWPVQKLCDITVDDVHLGRSIYNAKWIDLKPDAGVVGHLLILGDHGAVVQQLNLETLNGSRKIKHRRVAGHIYDRLIYSQYIAFLNSMTTNDGCSMVYLVAGTSVDPEIDDESGMDTSLLLSIHSNPGQDLNITQSSEAAFVEGLPPGMTVLDSLYHHHGTIIIGTREGTLEFFQSTSEEGSQLERKGTAVIASEGDQPSFVSCIATCAHAPYIACVTSFDTHQNEDKLHILQSESMRGGLEYKTEDTFLSPCGNIAQITWIQTPSPFPTLVVGYQAGQVDILVRKRQGLWAVVGRYQSSLEVTTVTTTRRGLPVVGAGRHMLFLSTDAHCFKDDALDDNSIMHAALTVGGALPSYHPTSLMTMLQLGLVRSFETAVVDMIDYVRKWERTPEEERLKSMHPPRINGPSSLLPEVFAEAIVPETAGLKIGEIVDSVPFSLEHPSLTSDEKPVVQSLQVAKQEETSVNDYFMTGQFDMSQFNNFAEETNIAPTFEATGLLDMSAFGMDFNASPSETEEEMPRDIRPTTSHAQESSAKAEIANGHDEPLHQSQETEPCVLFHSDQNIDDQIQGMTSEIDLDLQYAIRVLRRSEIPSETTLPLNCLLQLSDNHLDVLADLISLYDKWSCDFLKMSLDLPGKKFLSAVKLMSLSVKAQPKKVTSMNSIPEFRREDYVSPFLRLESYPSVISRESVASDSSNASVDDRLTEGYVSWPKSVGIAPGIEAIHLLWVLESEDPNAVLSACLEAMDSEATEKLERYAWERLKMLGIGFWIRDRAEAIKIADEVAREQFKRSNDPHDCALLYIALGKQNLLSRLFRSNGFARVADLLAKDFSQEHYQQTAAKNAFVLLGQHRHALAAAFFLVGGYTEDAIGVCCKEMQDPQLALFLTRLLDIDCTKIRNEIITKNLLPQSVEADDRVAQGLLLWLMDDKAEALRAITTVKALKSELSIADRAVSKILLLQFVLQQGQQYLSGRYVPLWMLDQIKNVAAHCAHILETCGMPTLALKALLCCQSLEAAFPYSQSGDIYDQWMTRLVASIMMIHLPSPQAVNARDPAMILWHQHVQQDVTMLHSSGVDVDGEVIFQQMQHIMDCLYEVPSSPLFAKRTSHPPDLASSGAKMTSSEPPAETPPSETAFQSTEKEESVSNIVSSESCDLLQIDGDRCVGVCFANDNGFYGVRRLSTKRVAVATGKHGLHYIDWDPVEESKFKTDFSAIYKEFERQRWPSLEWLKESSVLDNQGTPISMRGIIGGALKSHPSSSFFLSGSPVRERASAKACLGCNTDSLLLWQYGVGVPSARFRLQGRGINSIHRFAWSDTGDRIAAVSENGHCAMWDVINAQYDTTGLPNWTFQVAPKKGYDVSFVHGSGSVLVTSGEDELGRGLFSLWDTLAPHSSCRIAHLEYRHAITEIATVPGTLIFLSAHQSGSIHAHDLRMLGTSDPKLLWALNSIHDGPINCLEVGWAPSLYRQGWELTVASGGSDGDICLSNMITESGHLRQRLRKAHWKKSGQLAHLLFSGLKGNLGNVSVPPFGVQRLHPESATGLPVMDLDWCDEGLLTAGGDGFVQLFPFSPLHVPCVRSL